MFQKLFQRIFIMVCGVPQWIFGFGGKVEPASRRGIRSPSPFRSLHRNGGAFHLFLKIPDTAGGLPAAPK